MPKQSKFVNPIIARKMDLIFNWHHWLTLWAEATTLEQMLGLLHCGFTVSLNKKYGEPKYEEVDRVAFFLEIADGWADESSLRAKGEDRDRETFTLGYDKNGNPNRYSEAGLRKMIARKAFELLCVNYFNHEPKYRDEYSSKWSELVVSAKIYPLLQHFFRVVRCDHEQAKLANVGDSWRPTHHDEIVKAFMLNLANFVWEYKLKTRAWEKRSSEDEQKDEEFQARLDASKPWLIEVLRFYDELGRLRKHLLNLDKPCLAKLGELAMRNEIKEWPNNRPVANLNEARYVRSKAAWLLAERELNLRMKKMFEKERATRERAQKEKNKQVEIGRAKKEAEAAQAKLKALKG